MVTKIIFLDVDGVLNHATFYRNRKIDQKQQEQTYPLCEIDPVCVGYLSSLVEQTGAKVVISSYWRNGRTIQEMQNILNYHGFTGEIIDFTPVLRNDECLRGNEILKWVKDNKELIGSEYHNYYNYVILDDDSDMLYWQKDNFILVDSFIGITPQTVFKAKQILNRGTQGTTE